jgi:hypothetical protein
MKKRIYYILALVLFVFVLALVILSGEGPVLYCSANSPRVSGVAEWEKAISPIAMLKAVSCALILRTSN